MIRLDLTGQKFFSLKVLSRTENFQGRTRWNCKCDCGTFLPVKTKDLRNGKRKMCPKCKLRLKD